jgi:hypothetical protein
MNEHESPADELFERFLDGQLEGAEKSALADSVRSDPALGDAAALQSRIEGALGRMFDVLPPSEEALAALLARKPAVQLGAADRAAATRRRAIGWAAALATAAAIGAIALWKPWAASIPHSHFTPQPLATLYRMAVKQGFEPYYECDDPERFAQTFAHRQNIPLALLPMAAGSRMLGLSYLGGLSPDTTAMLCMVDEKPVIVFVDRAMADVPTAIAELGPDLHAFRRADHGLVIYEVTPLEEAKVIDSLAPAKSDG